MKPSLRAKIQNYIYRMVGDSGAAEDITERSILKCVEHYEAKRGAQFTTMLFSTSSNMAKDWLKRRRVRTRFEEQEEREPRQQSPRSAFANMLSREALELFDLEVRKLTKRERQVLLLRVIHLLSYDEICRRLRIEGVNARLIFHRAKAKLHRWLGYMKAE